MILLNKVKTQNIKFTEEMIKIITPTFEDQLIATTSEPTGKQPINK